MPGTVLSAQLQKPELHANLYGVRWNKNDPSTELTRLYQGVGKQAGSAVGASGGSSDFDYQPIFRDIKLCNIRNGKVTAYMGEENFTRTPAAGDVCVEIPKYYYKIVDTPDTRDYLISDAPMIGFSPSPRHAPHAGAPNGYDKIYVSAYTLNDDFRSISRVKSKVNLTRSEFRTSIRQRGTGFHLWDYATYWTIGLLYLVEYADWDAQVKIGPGYMDPAHTTDVNTGSTDSIAYHTGRTDSDANLGNNCIKYRHMENLWGNLFSFLDGVNFFDHYIYVCLNPEHYTDDTYVNYHRLSYQKSSTPIYSTETGEVCGWTKSMGYDHDYPWAQISTELNGTYYTYNCSYYVSFNGWRVAHCGGGWGTGAFATLFSVHPRYLTTTVSPDLGARLLILPPA